MKLFQLISSAALLACSTLGVVRADECPMPKPKMSPTLERMKALTGRWEGTSIEKGKEEPVVVKYRLTSGNSALVETISPDTPHEMVSVYHDRGNSFVMTHYCMLGNQPTMKLKQSTANQLSFELSGTEGLKTSNEPHMHALTISFIDPDTILQRWAFYDQGKAKFETTFKLHRVG